MSVFLYKYSQNWTILSGIQIRMKMIFKRHLNTRLFNDRTSFNYSQTGPVRNSYAFCSKLHLFLNFQTATVLRRTYTPPPLGPYATKHQINQTVFSENKYRRYDVEVEDDEAKTMEAPIKIIILKTMEGKIWLLENLLVNCA